jgi:hypothetical protein
MRIKHWRIKERGVSEKKEKKAKKKMERERGKDKGYK